MNIVRKVQRAFVKYLESQETGIPEGQIYRGLENRYAPKDSNDAGSDSPEAILTLPCVIVECNQLDFSESQHGDARGQVLFILKASADEFNDDRFDELFTAALGPLFEDQLPALIKDLIPDFGCTFSKPLRTGYDIEGRTWEGFLELEIVVQNQAIE